MKNNKLLIIVIALVCIVFIGGSLFLCLSNKKSRNSVAGKYNCKSYNANSTSDDYVISLHLYDDNTFIYGPYSDIDDNHYKGDYTYEKETKKSNDNKDYKFYMFKLVSDEYMVNGKKKEQKGHSTNLEFAMTKNDDGKREGAIIFTASYNMYYCYEE